MTRKYTQEQKSFIAANVKGRSTAELTKLFNERFGLNMTQSAMKAYKNNHKLKSGLPTGKHEPPRELVERRTFIKTHVKGRSTEELTKMFNEHFGLDWTVEQVKSFKHRNKFSSGLTGHFEKGHIPANKGKKGVGGWEPTQFKKGQRPVNYMPVGSERVNTDGYVDVKIADPNIWKAKHRIMWEEANGPVPKGYKLIFGDGNKLNVTLDNLILVSNGQLAVLNTKRLVQDNIELTRMGIVVADIYLKIGERKRAK